MTQSGRSPNEERELNRIFKKLSRSLQLMLGSIIAIYLIFFESPEVYDCEWWACSVLVTFHWYQPILFIAAAYLLCAGFWRLCRSSNAAGFAREEYPPPFDHQWQQPWPSHYFHYDIYFG